MGANTDPQIFRMSHNKPRLMMLLLHSQEEQVQIDEDMDSYGPTITMPPADLDIVDPLQHTQLPLPTFEMDDDDVYRRHGFTIVDVHSEFDPIGYQEEDNTLLEMDDFDFRRSQD